MFFCIRTTIRVDDVVLRDAKAAAARSGRTLTRYIEDALRTQLAVTAKVHATEVYRVRTFDSAIRPGVDLDSNADLLDVMER